MEIIRFSSGDFSEEISIPSKNLKKILIPKETLPVKKPEESVEFALTNPIDSKPLEQLLKPQSKISIIIDDATRQTPTSFVLRILLRKLKKIGIKPDNIVIQVANGLHRLTTLEEKKRLVGEDIFEVFGVHDNNVEKDQYQYFGKTSNGTPLYFNKRAVSADLIITIGIIKSHSFAGFTGGAKSIVPGISNKETILSNHRFEHIEYPNGILGDAEKSATRRDMEEATCRLPIFIINVVLNNKSEIIGVVAGDVIAAHRKGVKIFKKMAEIYIDEPADLIIVEGGYPGSINFYQALFGCNVILTTRKPILREKGTIVLFAQCKEGMGSSIIEELFSKYKTPGKVLKYLRNNPPQSEQWAAQFLAFFLLRSHLTVVTSSTLSKKLTSFGITCFNSVQEALSDFLLKNKDANIIVIKNPDFLIPNLR